MEISSLTCAQTGGSLHWAARLWRTRFSRRLWILPKQKSGLRARLHCPGTSSEGGVPSPEPFAQQLDGQEKPCAAVGRCQKVSDLGQRRHAQASHCWRGHWHLHPFSFQSLLDGLNHFSSPRNRDSNFFRARSSNMASPYASCSSLSWRSYCSLMSRDLARRAFSKPFLPLSTQSSISEG